MYRPTLLARGDRLRAASMRQSRAHAVAVALILALTGCGLPAAAALNDGETDQGRYYLVRSASSSLCLDVPGWSWKIGEAVVQNGCSGQATQSWFFRQVDPDAYQLTVKHDALCLRVAGGATADGTPVTQEPCARAGAAFNGTRFVVSRVGTSTPATYQLRTSAPGMCLRSPSNLIADRPIQAPCETTSSFLWQLEALAYRPAANSTGRWSPVYPLPSIPVTAALLPNRKVLTMASAQPYDVPGSDVTYTVLIDPANPTAPIENVVTNTVHNMFCPGTAMLADGRLFVNGGDDQATPTSNTSIYDYRTDTWTRGPTMTEQRWYNSSVTLSTGEVFTLGGNRTSRLSGAGEVWSPLTNRWVLEPGASMAPITTTVAENRSEEHPNIYLAPDGRLFYAGPNPRMQWYSALGQGGSVQDAGVRSDDEFSQNAVTVMFDKGKIFKAGGNPNYRRTRAEFTPSNRNSYIIDINAATPKVLKVSPMRYPRAYANAVVLPNGQVLVIGGTDHGRAASDDGAIMVPEVFNPSTRVWTELAPMSRPRTYHSVALLLDDGRVLVGGGGLCGTCGTRNHPDMEIFSPPYLFQGARPTVSAPAAITANGGTFDVTVSGNVTAFSLVRLSSVTHTVNTDQRFLWLSSTGAGATRTLTAPANHNLAPPGYYMLFALNGEVPSVAAMVRVK